MTRRVVISFRLTQRRNELFRRLVTGAGETERRVHSHRTGKTLMVDSTGSSEQGRKVHRFYETAI